MASIKDGAANSAPTKKTEVKQMPLTFKTRDSLEMALYDFLKAKRNRGVFIKDLLINAMFKECPEIAASFGASAAIENTSIKIVAKPIKVQVEPQEYSAANTGNTVTPDNDIEIEDNNETPLNITRGRNTLDMF